jgi:MFS family permease
MASVLADLIGGFGQDLATLAVGRVLIGIGSSAVYPSAMALIRRRASAAGLTAPPGGVLGGLVIAGSATAALGLSVGGVLVDAWGWRSTFFINLPVAVCPCSAAFSCLAASAGALLLTTSTPIAWIVVITLGSGITLGAMVSANQTTPYHQVPAGQIGTASGLFKTFGSIGSIASSAIIAVAFHAGVNETHLHTLALIMVIVSIFGVLLMVTGRALMSRSVISSTPTTPAAPMGGQRAITPVSSRRGSRRRLDSRVPCPRTTVRADAP